MPSRPNILLITSDQQRADCFGFENPHVRTPHIDGLAREGTRFSACITPNLVCQPARASILTGLLPLTHGVWDNGIDLDPHVGERGFAGTLARAGYRTAFVGKAHFATKATFRPTGTPECRSSGARYGPEWVGPYMGFEHVELAVLGHFDNPCPVERPPVGHYERWLYSRAPEEEVERLYRASLRPGVGATQTWHSALPVEWHSSSWIAERAIHWLEGRDRSRPFCMWVSFPDPHQPFDCPAPWSFLYDPKSVPLPGDRRRDLERRPWWYKATLEGTPRLADPGMRELRAKVSRIPDQSDEQLAHMTANYYGMISLIDHNVGRILEALEAHGLAQNTLVVFTTDHGEMLGNHGLYLKGPWPLEDLLRVGLIARGPGVKRGQVIAEPVSTLDLAPSFCDYAGVSAVADLQGKTLRSMLEGGSETRAAAWSEWHVHPARCGVELKLRTVRTRRYKCTFELESGAGELYDLQNDPGEMTNLFDDPGYRRVRNELEAMMRARPGRMRDDLAEPIGIA
ncbi:MAG: sulfatase-like hydrolase/transferase [Betaproteobacteria bacterium]|nr:sulfatase-like hydrolase/transferase [Betaproteobacteria bacterium]